jgi:hypothetical protein
MPRRSDGRGPLARLFRSRRAERSAAAAAVQADHEGTVGRAVRALVAACGAGGRAVPPVHALVIGSDTAWFRLSSPDERPPAGWTVDDQGRTWHTPLAWLQSTDLPASLNEPYPRLVGFGHTSRGFVLLNLGQAGGIVGLEGDERQARSLAQKWIDELTTNPRSRGVRVVRVGFTPTTAELAGTVEVATLADAAPALADELGGVLLLASPPSGSEREHVRTLAADSMGRWSVVVVGRVEDALWRFTVDSTGVVESALLDEPVLRRPASPPSVRDNDTAIIPGAYPIDGDEHRSSQRGPLVTRTRVIVASVCAACLLVAAGVLVSPTIIHASAQDTPRSAPSSPSQSQLSRPSPTNASPTPSPSTKPSPTATPPSKHPHTAASPSTHPAKTPTTTGIKAGGTGEIRGVASGMCVDSDTNPAVTLNGQPSGGHAFTNPCTQSPTEQWQEGPLLSNDSPRGANLYRLVDHKTGLCLDSDGNGGIYALPCLNPDQYQVWQRVSKGTTVAYRDQVTNRCLAVSTSDGTLKTQPCPTNGYPNNMLFSRPR